MFSLTASTRTRPSYGSITASGVPWGIIKGVFGARSIPLILTRSGVKSFGKVHFTAPFSGLMPVNNVAKALGSPGLKLVRDVEISVPSGATVSVFTSYESGPDGHHKLHFLSRGRHLTHN